ncbi:CopG family transcriptional regulator [Bosea vaviloviae]|jgi:antitoxin ParD1/3/4|uniref:CopG family transcriptional regulator n=2 Tax=Boseaceae TaxID=2831100 RepID=A0A0N1F6P4_9HYPH|nr:CopG family transcriptional regulator [Bosea vaviloviae]
MKHDAMRPLTISLSPKQLSRLSQAVESGAYASNSEVVRDALRLWEQREEIRALELARLKQAYDEGIASGEPVEADLAFARIRANVFGEQDA